MASIKKSWALSVLEQCLRLVDVKGFLTNQILLKHGLDQIIKDTQSLGKTPAQTMSRVLQDLRDLGLLIFHGRGKYELKGTIFDLMRIIDRRIKKSKGEKLIAQILAEMGIVFQEEKKFKNLKDKGHLRFDFYFEHGNRKFVIEFDGLQHEKPVEFFGGIQALTVLKKHDEMKNLFCEKKDINLIRLNKLDSNLIRKTIKNRLEEVDLTDRLIKINLNL